MSPTDILDHEKQSTQALRHQAAGSEGNASASRVVPPGRKYIHLCGQLSEWLRAASAGAGTGLAGACVCSPGRLWRAAMDRVGRGELPGNRGKGPPGWFPHAVERNWPWANAGFENTSKALFSA